MTASGVLRIDRIRVGGFRNLQPLELVPGERFNVVHGDNGAGKSNLLEAIHYLGGLSSFRGARTDDLIARGGRDAVIEARISGDVAPRSFRVALHRGRARELSIDGKRPRSIAQWRAALQMVIFHPGDLALATGAPEARRAFLDRTLEQMDPTYASTLASYTKALRSRNRLLRAERVDRRSITAFDELLSSAGAVIGRTRAGLVEDLGPRASHAFAEIVGAEPVLTIGYRPRVPPEPRALRRALEQAFDKDVARGFTADGPHADDVMIEVRGVTARHHASQGQHRAIVLALEIAERDALTQRTGRVPILLLDDVSSELDRTRNRRLFEQLARMGGQVFLTTTHPEFILLEAHRVDFRVEGGEVGRVEVASP